MKLFKTLKILLKICVLISLTWLLLPILISLFVKAWKENTFSLIKENIADADTSSNCNIFFIETAPTEYHKFNAHQLCSIESAALANPNSMIFVLLLTKKNHTHLDHTELVKSLLNYENVQFKFVNLETLTQNTPAEKFYKSNHLAASIHLVEHTADFLRILLLWKFGGTYLDHDVIVRKPITITNFACFQQPGVIVNGILNCDKQHGHDIAEKFLRSFIENFNPYTWGGNGPDVVTRILKKICKLDNATYLSAVCEHFTVLPIHECYEITYPEWEKFKIENEGYAKGVLERTNTSLFVHFWNKYMKGTKLNVNGKSAYVSFAKEFCPRVFKSCKRVF